MAPMKWKNPSPASKVEGRVRCHRCSTVCSDAAHYLSHKCGTTEPNPAGRTGRYRSGFSRHGNNPVAFAAS